MLRSRIQFSLTAFRFIFTISFTSIVLGNCIPSTGYASDLDKLPNPLVVQFSLTDVDGVQHKLSDYAGKVVLVTFWATWCPPCVRELPSMQQLYSLLDRNDFVVVGINVSESAEAVKRFLEKSELQLEFPVLLDSTMDTSRSWPVIALPTSFLIDKTGRIRFKAVGERDWLNETIHEAIQELIDDRV